MSIPATMRALEQTSLNGPQDLRLITDVPVPVPGPGEVLIRVTAAGVNFGDISQAYGTFLGGPPPPYLAGFEAAGEIAATGEAVTGLEPGACVIGVGIGCGAFAEYIVLPAAAVMPVPAGWAAEEALGLVVNWPTALAALRAPGAHCRRADRADPRRGGRDRPGRGQNGQALRRDGHRHRLARQA
jgi:NADPH2:quinone reductase